MNSTKLINKPERDEDADGRRRGYVNAALERALSRAVLAIARRWCCWPRLCSRWCSAGAASRSTSCANGCLREGGDAHPRDGATGRIARFISHYERITRHILTEMPARADHLIALDAARHAQWRR